jgi:hypothetical protein
MLDEIRELLNKEAEAVNKPVPDIEELICSNKIILDVYAPEPTRLEVRSTVLEITFMFAELNPVPDILEIK